MARGGSVGHHIVEQVIFQTTWKQYFYHLCTHKPLWYYFTIIVWSQTWASIVTKSPFVSNAPFWMQHKLLAGKVATQLLSLTGFYKINCMLSHFFLPWGVKRLCWLILFCQQFCLVSPENILNYIFLWSLRSEKSNRWSALTSSVS